MRVNQGQKDGMEPCNRIENEMGRAFEERKKECVAV